MIDTRYQYRNYSVLSWSQIKELAKDAGMEFELEEPKDDEIIQISHLYLLSLLTDRSHETVSINGKIYRQTVDTNIPYLGYLQ